jgi:hypothetical protein
VNSTSTASPVSRSSTATARASSAATAGSAVASAPIGCGVRSPDTSSSPWARATHSPVSPGVPVPGSRLNATPVPDRSSRLPNTIAWTTTAVPASWAMP